MATATRDKKIVTKTISETVPVVTLSLSVDEAEAALKTFYNVGGARTLGREHADSIIKALEAAGVRAKKYATMGTITFVEPDGPNSYDFFSPLASTSRLY